MTKSKHKMMLKMIIPHGEVDIQLRPDLAPKAAERLYELSEQGFYNNIAFHRVIPGFMAQAGDPTGTGMHGSDLPNLKSEFTDKEEFKRGTVGMARTMDPNSANSQFFIMFDAAPHLNGEYTIVGEVTKGMENVDKLKAGKGMSGMVDDPDRIVRMVPKKG